MKSFDEVSYSGMVRVLKKPGQAILDSLTPEKCDLWHMTSCLAPEVGELVAGLATLDRENAIEEAGDIEFYLEGAKQAGQVPMAYTERPAVIGSPYDQLLVALGDVFDEAKKYVIYEKDFNRYVFAVAISDAQVALETIYKLWGVTSDDIQTANKNKLSKRYHKLAYSDDQAQSRADKE